MEFKDSEYVEKGAKQRLERWTKSISDELEVIHYWDMKKTYLFVLHGKGINNNRTEYFIRIFENLKVWVLSEDMIQCID